MKLLGQVMAVEPLAIIISLPNQLMAHVPITNVSSQLTKLLESMDEDEDMPDDTSEDGDEDKPLRVPELFEIFHPGQYVRGIVTAVHAQGSSDVLGLARTRDDSLKASRRVELSLVPEQVNEGVTKTDLKPGYVSVHIVQTMSK